MDIRAFRSLRQLGALGALYAAMAAPCLGQVGFTITIDDPEGALSPWESQIESNLQAAGALWAAKLHGACTLWVHITPMADAGTLDCRSFTWSYFETLDNAIDVFETGASTHIRNGFPASSFDPDIELRISPLYLASELWMDPNPTERTEPVPANRIDGVSAFARELGYALAFDGWINGETGSFPGNSRSTFDRLIAFDGQEFAFVGSSATASYQGPVPLTFGLPFHLGNQSPRPGPVLLDDLMGGKPLQPGTRYNVSELDFAILRDARVPIAVPCPCDLTHDGFVDDADFGAFSLAYDFCDCTDPEMAAGCPADFTRDRMVDDSDYVIFVQGYEDFICP
ncbi:MAG: hypothetical protein JSS51_05545 [Planctomycetes bacterium]|nr:hypothetical protein [Planctomycetota bacterium]